MKRNFMKKLLLSSLFAMFTSVVMAQSPTAVVRQIYQQARHLDKPTLQIVQHYATPEFRQLIAQYFEELNSANTVLPICTTYEIIWSSDDPQMHAKIHLSTLAHQQVRAQFVQGGRHKEVIYSLKCQHNTCQVDDIFENNVHWKQELHQCLHRHYPAKYPVPVMEVPKIVETTVQQNNHQQHLSDNDDSILAVPISETEKVVIHHEPIFNIEVEYIEDKTLPTLADFHSAVEINTHVEYLQDNVSDININSHQKWSSNAEEQWTYHDWKHAPVMETTVQYLDEHPHKALQAIQEDIEKIQMDMELLMQK